MAIDGTASYAGEPDLPPLVRRAVDVARRAGFANSCRPEHGRLLHALARGADAIGETGTGCGVGLAWLVSGARAGTRFVSVDQDADRVAQAREVFADVPGVEIRLGDWTAVEEAAPYDLLVLDGGGQGKGGGSPAAPDVLLRPGGTLVVDDLTPARHWPPRHEGAVDEARLYWLRHPALDAAELRLAPDLSALVATRRFPES
jgi:predicted O-methyltransferase YrrM